MKEKLLAMKDKVFQWVSGLSKKTVIVAGAVFVIALAIVLNLILLGDNAVPGGDLDASIDLSGDGEKQGESTVNPINEYFASMSLNRQTSREEAIAVLNAIAESETAVSEMKEQAMDNIATIAAAMEKEANIETLIKAKGFSKCLAIIEDGKATVIVESDGLLPSQIAQISEIVHEQAGILPADLKIIEKANAS